MNAITKILLMSFIIFQTMYSSETEMRLMRSAASQTNYGSGKSAVKPFAQDASAAVVRQQKIAEIQLKIDALHEKIKTVRSEAADVRAKITALDLQSK